MNVPIFRVDAFTDRAFGGNPAAVCLLDAWLPPGSMQVLAEENRMPATAFVVPEGNHYRLRWFTPRVEEELCGHGTVAAAHVVHTVLRPGCGDILFESPAGPLPVAVRDGRYTIDVPARKPVACSPPPALLEALGAPPAEVLAAASYIAIYETADIVERLTPDLQALSSLDLPGVVVSAPGRDCDIESRYFAPAKGIPEDPVTGSAHAQLLPYWAERLGRGTLDARQLSERGGRMTCELRGDRALLTGAAVTTMRGETAVPS
ncbi:MAG: PhzF family phenazine biosynthesis protein [Acetobacterales bacterium]